MAETGIKELLEAGVHFGHQTRRWNPRMRRYIHGERHGIHIIDLLQTEQLLAKARDFAVEVASKGGTILFVSTKKQGTDAIEEWAGRAGMPYVNRRWLGGLLTNFNTISKRIARLEELRRLSEEDQLRMLPTKERLSMEAELGKLEYSLGGVREMKRLPDAAFVIDLNAEETAVREMARLGIPTIALVDTNCDPQPIDYVIPGNDDALRSCELIVRTIGEAVAEAASAWRTVEEQRLAEEERRLAEERKQAEEERRRAREAEEAAKAAAVAAEGAEPVAGEPAVGAPASAPTGAPAAVEAAPAGGAGEAEAAK